MIELFVEIEKQWVHIGQVTNYQISRDVKIETFAVRGPERVQIDFSLSGLANFAGLHGMLMGEKITFCLAFFDMGSVIRGTGWIRTSLHGFGTNRVVTASCELRMTDGPYVENLTDELRSQLVIPTTPAMMARKQSL